MVSPDREIQAPESRGYRIIIGVVVFLFLLITWYALTRVAVRLEYIRTHMRGWIGTAIFWLLVLFCLVMVVLFLIHLRSKKVDRDQKKQVATQKKA